MDEPVVRKRSRPACLPPVRKRVRKAAPETAAAPSPAPKRFPRRNYTTDEAEFLAGKPEDPVARGAYSNSAIMDFSVFSEGPGDKMMGKVWRRSDGQCHVWGITAEGTLKYRGLWTGNTREIFDRLSAACRSTAQARAGMKKPPIHYQEYKSK